MNKPTVFFSHSSKDKDMVITIKDKIANYTGNVLDIFVSSDGQSIPFGRNWIHKIEDGLNDAKIMFIFVTENSISTGWVYFEAGFAYSKGIQVVPVGIGIDIGSLKTPLNLLQGFNIVSHESLNNFFSIINKTFEYNFCERFSAKDYDEIISRFPLNPDIDTHFDEIIQSVKCRFMSEFDNYPGMIEHNIREYFDKIEHYLEASNIPYSCENANYMHLMVKGINIVCRRNAYTRNGHAPMDIMAINISPYNFGESFELYRAINILLDREGAFYIHIRLREDYSYVSSDEDFSALLSSDNNWFSFSKDGIGHYECKRLGLKFSAFNYNRDQKKAPDTVLSVVYDPKTNCAADIMSLVSKLKELGLIYKRGEGASHA